MECNTVTISKAQPIKKFSGSAKKGEVRNPKGRPLSSRNKLSEWLLRDLSEDWSRHGTEAIAKMRNLDPVAYVRVCASLVPKEASLTVKNDLETMSEADLKALIRQELGETAKVIDATVED